MGRKEFHVKRSLMIQKGLGPQDTVEAKQDFCFQPSLPDGHLKTGGIAYQDNCESGSP
jgi:hypothetical protein